MAMSEVRGWCVSKNQPGKRVGWFAIGKVCGARAKSCACAMGRPFALCVHCMDYEHCCDTSDACVIVARFQRAPAAIIFLSDSPHALLAGAKCSSCGWCLLSLYCTHEIPLLYQLVSSIDRINTHLIIQPGLIRHWVYFANAKKQSKSKNTPKMFLITAVQAGI